MRKALAVLVLASFVFALGFSIGSAEDTERAYFKVKNEATKHLLKDIKKHEFRDGIIVVETSKKLIEKLKKNPNLEFAGNDIIYEVDGSVDFAYAQRGVLPRKMPADDPPSGGEGSSGGIFNRTCPYRLADYNLSPVHYGIKYMYNNLNLTRSWGGSGVKVAVLDTGANITHPDIMSRVIYCRDVTTNTSTCDDTSTYTVGHGTGVSSVIAADSGPDGLGMWGMAPQSKLYIIKVCRGNSCFESDIIAGLYEAVNQNVNIISMSFASSSMSTVMRDALDYAYSHNILLVAGAGNSGPDYNTIKYPAAHSKVMAVAAINEDYSTWPLSSRGINNGDYVIEEREIEVAAPGTGILIASKRGCWAYAGGTSYATPHVSGLAAKIWDGNASSVRAKLQASAKFHDLDAWGDDNATGFGMPTVNPEYLRQANLNTSLSTSWYEIG